MLKVASYNLYNLLFITSSILRSFLDWMYTCTLLSSYNHRTSNLLDWGLEIVVTTKITSDDSIITTLFWHLLARYVDLWKSTTCHTYNIINYISQLHFWNYITLKHCRIPSTCDKKCFLTCGNDHLDKWRVETVFTMPHHAVILASCTGFDVTYCEVFIVPLE